MKKILLCATALISTAGIAQDPAAPAAAQPAPAAASSAAALTCDSPIEALMAKPEAKALLIKYIPEIDNHPAYEQFKSMSVRQLQPLAGGIITDEKVTSLEADLKNVN